MRPVSIVLAGLLALAAVGAPSSRAAEPATPVLFHFEQAAGVCAWVLRPADRDALRFHHRTPACPVEVIWDPVERRTVYVTAVDIQMLRWASAARPVILGPLPSEGGARFDPAGLWLDRETGRPRHASDGAGAVQVRELIEGEWRVVEELPGTTGERQSAVALARLVAQPRAEVRSLGRLVADARTFWRGRERADVPAATRLTFWRQMEGNVDDGRIRPLAERAARLDPASPASVRVVPLRERGGAALAFPTVRFAGLFLLDELAVAPVHWASANGRSLGERLRLTYPGQDLDIVFPAVAISGDYVLVTSVEPGHTTGAAVFRAQQPLPQRAFADLGPIIVWAPFPALWDLAASN